MASLSQEQIKLIDSIAKSQNFQDYNLRVTSGSMKGDGYLGIINTIEIEEKTNKEKKLHLVLKAALTEEKLREKSPIKKAYERECYLYETVFPEFRKFAEEFHLKNGFQQVAKYYGGSLNDRNECVVLENLKEKHYRLWDRKTPMDSEHITLGFEAYGKLHATGIALKILKPKLYENLKKNLVNIFEKENETEDDRREFEVMSKAIFGNGFRAVAGDEKATAALGKFAQSCEHLFKDDLKKIDKGETILHGDCWCNNMMFKYDDLSNPARPTQICLLDWQISNVGSLICDLSYFLYSTTCKEVLDKWKDYLKIYHTSFSQIIQDCGLEPDEVLSYDELLNQWRKLSKFGLFMTLFVMRVVLSESEEAPDLSELAKSGKNIVESIFSAESVNIDSINKRIRDVVIFMDENELI